MMCMLICTLNSYTILIIYSCIPYMYIGALLQQAREIRKRLPYSKLGHRPYGKIALNIVLLILGSALGAFGTVNSVLSVYKR